MKAIAPSGMAMLIPIFALVVRCDGDDAGDGVTEGGEVTDWETFAEDVVVSTATVWLAGSVIAIGESCTGIVRKVTVAVGVIVIAGIPLVEQSIGPTKLAIAVSISDAKRA